MNILVNLILVPIVMALFCFIFKRVAAAIALVISALVLALAGLTFCYGGDSQFLALRALPFSAGVFLVVAFFTFLIVLYSLKFMEEHEQLGAYYGNILLSLGASAGVLFATDYLTLLLFWGILGVTLYLLVGVGGDRAAGAARKTLVIVGGSDALMIFGLGLIFALTGTIVIGVVRLPLNGPLPVLAFTGVSAGRA
jgi:formate hydrogenlyase subunit 3/multisubunit Na+/H+ antiporter MnhD subunit